MDGMRPHGWIGLALVALWLGPLEASTVKLKSGRAIRDVAKAERLDNGQMRIEQRDGFVLYIDAQQVVEVVPDEQDQAQQQVPQLGAAPPSTDEEDQRRAREEAFRRATAAKRAESESNYREIQSQRLVLEEKQPEPAPAPPQLQLVHGVVTEIVGPTSVRVSRLDRPVRIVGLAVPDPVAARDRLSWELSNDVVYVLYDPTSASEPVEAMLYDEAGRTVAPLLIKSGFFRVDPAVEVTFPTQISELARQRVEREGPIAYP